MQSGSCVACAGGRDMLCGACSGHHPRNPPPPQERDAVGARLRDSDFFLLVEKKTVCSSELHYSYAKDLLSLHSRTTYPQTHPHTNMTAR
jgi:hypothetical protein